MKTNKSIIVESIKDIFKNYNHDHYFNECYIVIILDNEIRKKYLRCCKDNESGKYYYWFALPEFKEVSSRKHIDSLEDSFNFFMLKKDLASHNLLMSLDEDDIKEIIE